MAVGSYHGPSTFMSRPHTQELSGVDIAVIGIPFDLATTNRSGARLGPRAIREQSGFVGEYPWGVWPWDFNALERCKVIDYGDIPFSVGYPDSMRESVRTHCARILDSGANVLALGGDHYVSFPLLQAHAARHGPLSLVHFDAHSDTWTSAEHNHGTMFYHAARDGLVDPKASIQIGMRTPNPDTHGFTVLDANWVDAHDPQAIARRVREVVGSKPVYLSFDIDFLDPAYAPGTGTPVVGGPTTATARAILHALRGLKVVGGDQVEVAPAYDPVGQITALAGATIAADILHLIAAARPG